MQRLVEMLGNPQLKTPTIHVAGTKGKGSVSAMIASGLTHSGLKTGVYASPHLESIRERFVIDGQLISESRLADSLRTVREAVELMDREIDDGLELRPVTFFEITTAVAMVYFLAEQVDWMILEVGLGGRLDSTVVCQPDLCVITNISLDHTRQLGTTCAAIAGEKAGILKPEVPLVCGVRNEEARQVIENRANELDCPHLLLGRDFDYQVDPSKKMSVFGIDPAYDFNLSDVQVSLAGEHQFENAAVAAVALKRVAVEQPIITDSAIKKGIASTSLKGRCEIIRSTDQCTTVILDMAHNVASAEALAKTLQFEIEKWSDIKERTLVFAVSQDKDRKRILKVLLPLFNRVVFTRYLENPRAVDPAELAEIAAELSNCEVDIAETPAFALQRAWEGMSKENAGRAICVAGSAFLCAEVRPLVSTVITTDSSAAIVH